MIFGDLLVTTFDDDFGVVAFGVVDFGVVDFGVVDFGVVDFVSDETTVDFAA